MTSNTKVNRSIDETIDVNPFYDHPLDPSELGLVVNRKKELEMLEQALKAASHGLRQNLAILGADGSGKTSLLNVVEGRGESIPNILMIKQEITSSTTELTFFKSIVGAVIHELEKLLGRSLFGDVKEIKKRVEGIVREESSVAEVSISIGALLTFLGFGGKFSAGEKTVKGRYEDVSEILPSLETVVRVVLSKRFKVIVVMIDEAGYAVSDTTKALLKNETAVPAAEFHADSQRQSHVNRRFGDHRAYACQFDTSNVEDFFGPSWAARYP